MKRLITIALLSVFSAAASAASACSSFPYDDLLFLSTFLPAESYSSAHYPLPTVTVTITVAPAMEVRRAKITKTSTKTSKSSITKTTTIKPLQLIQQCEYPPKESQTPIQEYSTEPPNHQVHRQLVPELAPYGLALSPKSSLYCRLCVLALRQLPQPQYVQPG